MSAGIFKGWPDVAIPKIKDGTAGFTLTEDDISLMVVMSCIGEVIIPIPAGYAMDKIGRRRSMFILNLVNLIFWVYLYFSKSAISVYVTLFISGVYAGFQSAFIPIYISEVTSPKLRGSSGSFCEFMFCFGAMYVSSLAPLNYQTFVLVSMIPSILSLFGFMMVPESPYYDLMKGNKEMAAQTLEWLGGSTQMQHVDEIERAMADQLKNEGGYFQVFKFPHVLRAFVLVELLMIVMGNSSTTLLTAYTTEVLPDSWVSSSMSFTILCFVWVVSLAIYTTLMDKVNRRTLLYISCMGTSLGLTATSVWYYLRDKTNFDTSGTNWVPLVTIMIVGLFEAGGIANIPLVIKGEIFPMNMKSYCIALSNVTYSASETISIFYFYPTANMLGMYFIFVKVLITTLICAFVTKFMLVETRGRSLETIQEILSSKKLPNEQNN